MRQLSFLLSIFLLVIWCCFGEDVSTFLNIDAFTRGIDFETYSGDAPLGTGDVAKGGIKVPFLEITYDKGRMTADERTKIPDQYEVARTPWCDVSIVSEFITTEEEFSKMESSKKGFDVGVGFGGFELGFSDGSTSSQLTEWIKVKRGTIVHTYMRCDDYSGTLLPDHLIFSEEFISWVAKLPLAYDEVYEWGLNLFGTLAPVQVSMGAYMEVFYLLREYYQYDHSLTKEQAEMGADFNFMSFFSMGGEDTSETTTEIVSRFNKSVEKTYIFAYGGKPYQTDKAAWGEAVGTNPQATSARFTLMCNFLKAQNFPNDTNITTKFELCINATLKLCPMCIVPTTPESAVYPLPENSNQAKVNGPDSCGKQTGERLLYAPDVSFAINKDNIAYYTGTNISLWAINLSDPSPIWAYSTGLVPNLPRNIALFENGDLVFAHSTLLCHIPFGAATPSVCQNTDRYLNGVKVSPNGNIVVTTSASIAAFSYSPDANFTLIWEANITKTTSQVPFAIDKYGYVYALNHDGLARISPDNGNYVRLVPYIGTGGALRLSLDTAFFTVVGEEEPPSTMVYAVDTKWGWQRWAREATNVLAIDSTSKIVYVSNSPGIQAIAELSGRELWSLDLTNFTSSPAYGCTIGADSTLYCLTTNNTLSISPFNGKVLWMVPFGAATGGSLAIGQDGMLVALLANGVAPLRLYTFASGDNGFTCGPLP